MENQHTKGPWFYQFSQSPAIGKRFGIYQESTGDYVAKVDMAHDNEMKECEANARLIAAAPALLEALEKAFISLGRDGGNMETAKGFENAIPQGKRRQAWLEARAALKQAKGL